MAKKKKSHKVHRRRRSSRMGAVNLKSVGMKIAGIAGAAFVDNLVKKNMTSLNPKIVGVVEIVGGVFLPKFLKGDIGEGIGEGLVAVGTINLLKSFSVISGVGAIPARVPLRRGTISPGQPAIGAAGRPYLSQNVGSVRPASPELQIMGSLYSED